VTGPEIQWVEFLQWALPRLGLRWPGFRKVRRQVIRRIARRIEALQLGDLDHYRRYLEAHAEEWPRLDGCCRITISRFYRDRQVFDALAQAGLPELVRLCRTRGNAGSGAGARAVARARKRTPSF
jgi:chemotaxis protein methyltransferase CheR